jgi:WD40 repeat protein
VDAFAITSDGRRLVVAFSRQSMDPGDPRHRVSWTYHLAVVPFKSGGRVSPLDLERPVDLLAMQPVGSRCATITGEDTKEVHLCEEPGGEPIADYPLPTAQTGMLAFSPDGRLLAVPNFRTVYLLDSKRLREVGTLVGHTKKVNALAFTADGRQIITASHDETVRVWDVAAAKELRTYDWKIGLVSAIAIAPDGLTCAAGGTRGRIVVWDNE